MDVVETGGATVVALTATDVWLQTRTSMVALTDSVPRTWRKISYSGQENTCIAPPRWERRPSVTRSPQRVQ
jgi:hypothetical protein